MRVIIVMMLLTVLPWNSWCCKGKESAEAQFQEFILKFNKTYNGKQEYKKRLKIFTDSLKEIEQLNKKANGQTVYGVNEFADQSWAEFKSKRLMNSPPPEIEHANIYKAPIRQARRPDSIDWRPIMSPVKNQGDCGSCWAFSATAVMEATHYRTRNRKLIFSEQELVDCSEQQGNYACAGGWPSNAFIYSINKGLSVASVYPYRGIQQACRPPSLGKYKLTNWTNIPTEEDMVNYLANKGPIAVAIKAGRGVSLYEGGMMSVNPCSEQVNHAVTVVGYGTSGGVPYWLIRNSWGERWGEGGYARVPRGINWCGITTYPPSGAWF